jgi:hypothetical protein
VLAGNLSFVLCLLPRRPMRLSCNTSFASSIRRGSGVALQGRIVPRLPYGVDEPGSASLSFQASNAGSDHQPPYPLLSNSPTSPVPKSSNYATAPSFPAVNIFPAPFRLHARLSANIGTVDGHHTKTTALRHPLFDVVVTKVYTYNEQQSHVLFARFLYAYD